MSLLAHASFAFFSASRIQEDLQAVANPFLHQSVHFLFVHCAAAAVLIPEEVATAVLLGALGPRDRCADDFRRCLSWSCRDDQRGYFFKSPKQTVLDAAYNLQAF